MQTKKQQQDEQLLEEFLKLRPIRAIDRMLSQHSLDRVYGLYGNLQQKVRKNTSDLRATLTDKYENLVDCSNLLINIQNFTHEIQSIEKDISKIFRQNPLLEQLQGKDNKKSFVSRIEELLYRKKFTQAMELSYITDEDIQESQRLYLPFLRIEVVEKLQAELLGIKINEKFINEIISCLKTYINGFSESQKEQVISNVEQFQEGTLLHLLSSLFASKSEVDEGDLLQIVFKCKLFSLSRSQRGITQEDRISKFFHDINQLLGQKSRNSDQVNKLAQIFCENWAQIQTHLSETFIVTNQGQIITFRYDLYDKLLSSDSFLSILNSLDSVIASSCNSEVRVSLRQSFLNLWNNYYQQLLNLLFARVDPTEKLPKRQQKQEEIPAELKKYFTSDIVIEDYLKIYRSQLQLLLGNVRQLMSKSAHLGNKVLKEADIVKEIQSCYKAKINEINLKIAKSQKQLSKNISQQNLHALILLFFYCEEFGRAVDTAATSSNLQGLTCYKLKWNEKVASQFNLLFYKQGHKNWSISFDRFFMNYNPCVLETSQTDIVKKIILALLQGMMISKDSKRAHTLISEHSLKKEKEQKEARDSRSRLPDIPAGAQSADMFKKKSSLGA